MFLKNISFLALLLVILSCSSDDDSSSNQITNTTALPTNTPLPTTNNVEVLNENLVHDGLVLAVENGSNKSYLIDRNGNHYRDFNFDTNLGNDLEILNNGKLLGSFKVNGTAFSFGGYGGKARIINPDGSLEWEYTIANDDQLAHHDVEQLPNGNILMLVWERVTQAEANALGINANNDIFPESLYEINPNTNQIVWEWKSINHLIQDQDSSLPNFGSINQNPNKIDFNYNIVSGNGDIMHANGIDYDSEKDVIYLSVNFYSEVWVIDHSTSISESNSSNGGNYNIGGDLIYRFGNPTTYQNTSGNRLFYNNHFPNLLENAVPGEGNLLIYVNGGASNQSKVYELDMPDNFNLIADTNNEPAIVWSFTDVDLYLGHISGADRLPNGNTLICEGDYGFWEVTQSGEVVWKYSGLGQTTFWRGYGYSYDDDAILNLN